MGCVYLSDYLAYGLYLFIGLFMGRVYFLDYSSVIQVISGQQLPKVNIKEGSIVDPLVRVEIHGVPLDQGKQETRYIENNGTVKLPVLESFDSLKM